MIAGSYNYPPQTGAIDEKIMGIGAHTDYGNLTILAQDDVGGLQVMNRDGNWIQGSPIPGTFVINIGDLIQRLTNDVYLANMHRVINTSGRERYSIPFFIDADYDAKFGPLASCVSAENPQRYQSVTCGAHKFGRFSASYAHLEKGKLNNTPDILPFDPPQLGARSSGDLFVAAGHRDS